MQNRREVCIGEMRIYNAIIHAIQYTNKHKNMKIICNNHEIFYVGEANEK